MRLLSRDDDGLETPGQVGVHEPGPAQRRSAESSPIHARRDKAEHSLVTALLVGDALVQLCRPATETSAVGERLQGRDLVEAAFDLAAPIWPGHWVSRWRRAPCPPSQAPRSPHICARTRELGFLGLPTFFQWISEVERANGVTGVGAEPVLAFGPPRFVRTLGQFSWTVRRRWCSSCRRRFVASPVPDNRRPPQCPARPRRLL